MPTLTRRRALGLGAAALGLPLLPRQSRAQTAAAFDMATLKDGFRRRLQAVAATGQVPIIDIESSFNPLDIDIDQVVADMDGAGIALSAFSVDQPGKLVRQGQGWNDMAFDLVRDHPDHFIPVGNGGNHPAWTRAPDQFLDDAAWKLLYGEEIRLG